MSPAPILICNDRSLERRAAATLHRLPEIDGRPVRLERASGLRDRHGPVHAASFLRERRMAFDCAAAEFPRIFVHELFHFAWARLGNPARWSFEDVVRGECRSGAHGELGWSAEWRKAELVGADVRGRTRRWREYCCESFCDTAAWLYSGVSRHSEFTLAARCRSFRRDWFRVSVETGVLSI